jgi:hypothetical protein
MPEGTFRGVKGYDVITRGLRRVDGMTMGLKKAVPYWDAAYEVPQDIAAHWGNNDAQFTVVITNKAMYKVEYKALDVYSPVFWQKALTKTSYTEATGVIVVTTDNPQILLIAAGDYVVSATNLALRYRIDSVSTTTITLVAASKPVAAAMTSATFYVLKEFKAVDPYYVDWAVYARSTTANMILVDGSIGGIYQYNGGYLQPFTLHDTLDAASYVSARTVMYFGGRLYFGCVGKDGKTYRQRTIWTEVLDLQEIAALSYQDLDETPGQIVKMLGLGPLAFIYFNDSVYYGRETNLAGLPYAFTKMDTGNVGLVGMKAVCTFFEGQLFIGPDEIYYISASQGLQPIGSPVLKESIKASQAYLQNCVLCMDVARNRVIAGFCSEKRKINKMFLYNYLTKAWSYVERPAVSAIAVVNFADEIELDDLGALTYQNYLDSGVTYAELGGSFSARTLTTLNPAGYMHTLALDQAGDHRIDADLPMTPIDTALETGDIDLDMPDTDKTALELRVKVAQGSTKRSASLEFAVTGSLDKGESWKTLGTLVIPSTKSEGSVGFRLTGSHFRLRLVSSSLIEPYEIVEMTIRAVARGTEANRATTSSNP